MIDINCDMGEIEEFMTSGYDVSLMPFVNSVNIACGFHAGSDKQMAYTIEQALKYNLKIGAHPGFEDWQNFGRAEIFLDYFQIKDLILRQLEVFFKISETFKIKINHVKPHGALYNISAKNRQYAKAIAEAVAEFSTDLILVGLSESLSVVEAQSLGLNTLNEVFADRYYLSDKSLASRSDGGLIEDLGKIENQIQCFLKKEPFETKDKSKVNIKAETICIHSDSANALQIARLVSEKVKLFYQSAT
ncbi:MAG: LamB/YcsF family protein [Bacteroidetes bacterium]|nr:LamB/YcsF family protein [Bacteroidota bacterium]